MNQVKNKYMKGNRDINEMEKFEEIPIDDFPSDLDESYLDNIIEVKSNKDSKNEQVKK